MSKSIEYSPTLVKLIISNVIDEVLERNNVELNEEEITKIVKDKFYLGITIDNMCRDRQAAKLIINIGERGLIVPEIHLKGSAAVKEFAEKK